jgi:hypothetical protein
MVRHRPVKAPGCLTAPSAGGFLGIPGVSYGERADLFLDTHPGVYPAPTALESI